MGIVDPQMTDTEFAGRQEVELPTSWYGRVYHKVEGLASSPYALALMLLISVVDGSVFPIPPFALLVPMTLAQPKRWWWFATLGTAASMAGGVLGYELGKLVHAGAMSFLSINLDAPVHRFGIDSTIGQLLGDNFWVLSLLCSVLPTPFKVVAIGSGMVLVPLGRFLIAALIGRTVRFFVVAGAMAFLGPRARRWLRV
jgi:membrane protein YqaA with SNARE-associated domain